MENVFNIRTPEDANRVVKLATSKNVVIVGASFLGERSLCGCPRLPADGPSPSPGLSLVTQGKPLFPPDQTLWWSNLQLQVGGRDISLVKKLILLTSWAVQLAWTGILLPQSEKHMASPVLVLGWFQTRHV